MDSHRNELIELIERKIITPDILEEAVYHAKLLPNSQRWFVFLNKLSLWIGCIALALSMIFFVAYNWAEFGKFAKFALVEGCLVLSVVAYLILKNDTLLKQGAIIFSSILVGVLLALFGQTYQTGADPWQLFFVWAGLITPWAITARLAVLWLMIIGLLNVSFTLYCDVNTNPLSVIFNTSIDLLWGLFLLNLVSFSLWHIASEKLSWLKNTWAMRLIALISGSLITLLAIMSAFEGNGTSNAAFPVWGLCMGGGYWLYRRKNYDLFMLAGGCLSSILVITTLCANLLFSHDGEFGAFLILAILVIGLGAGAAWWLSSVQKEVENEQ